MLIRLLALFLAAFAGWWTRNRGLSKDKAEEFLKELFESASQTGGKVEVAFRDIVRSGLKGGEEFFHALDHYVEGLISSTVSGLNKLLDEIRGDFSSKETGVSPDKLHLLRVDDSPESNEARAILRFHGILFREIDPESELGAMIKKRVAPPSLIAPDNRVFVGVNAIQVYCESRPDADDEGSGTAAAAAADSVQRV